jgi:hypothetical protein
MEAQMQGEKRATSTTFGVLSKVKFCRLSVAGKLFQPCIQLLSELLCVVVDLALL